MRTKYDLGVGVRNPVECAKANSKRAPQTSRARICAACELATILNLEEARTRKQVDREDRRGLFEVLAVDAALYRGGAEAVRC